MKKIKVFILIITVGMFFLSCQKNEIENKVSQTVKKPTKEQLEKLSKLGVNYNNVTIEKITLLDGSKDDYLIIDDIRIPVNKLELYSNLEPLENGNKQYRTSNLVSSANRTIDILGYTGNGFALTNKMRTALQWAVNNYNRLNTSLEFRLSFGPVIEFADIVVYNAGTDTAGAQAEFPSQGKPGKFIQIFAGMERFSNNVVEHVMTHEIGHSIGLRHQDWFDRQSCGTNTTSPPPVEPSAIWIPGTPIATNEDSVMLACFNDTEDGELSDSDILALEILYN